MPATELTALRAENTPDENARLGKVKGLIFLEEALQEDTQNVREYLDEIFEERKEQALSVDLDMTAIENAIDGLLHALRETKTAAQNSQVEMMKRAA